MTTRETPGVRVLLTGCTGFVGKVVLEEMLRRRDELGIAAVHLLIRPRRERSAQERFDDDVATSPCFSRLEPGWRELCHPVSGDIVDDGLGLDADATERLTAELTHVIHCAASVRFDLPVAEAAEINIGGALNVLEFARRCTALRRLVDVSTAYVTPHPGAGVPVHETLVDLPFDVEEAYASIVAGTADERALLRTSRHANTYTLTKCMAEVLLARRRGAVPLTLLRPSIVSACRRYPFPGWIDSRAAYAAFISLLGAGYLRVVRFDPNVTPDLVPCDDVAHRILACTFDPEQQEPLVVRHAVSGLENSGRLSDLARHHELYFQAHPHERPARWVYCGPSPMLFRINEWLHHHVPLSLARLGARMQRRHHDEAKIGKLHAAIGSLDRVFNYFGHHTFDFRTSFPPPEEFELDPYLDTISAGISHHLLKRDPCAARLQMHGTDAGWALRQPEGNATQRAFAYFMRKVLRGAGVEITFDEGSIKAALREVGPDDLVVLAPSHRSYMDFLVTSLLCFAHPGLKLRLPRVAATDDFARIPIVGPVLKGAGAFYIRRGTGAPDPALNEQLGELVRAGHSLEFYPEGKRSRSRRFLPAKRGILRALQGTGRRTVVLPLAISYDRIAEEAGFLRELDGTARHRGGLGPLGRWLMQLTKGRIRLGRTHIRCGTPLPLESDTDVPELGRQLIAELQKNIVATTFHLRAFCVTHAAAGIEPDALQAEIVRRGGLVIESRLDGADEVPELVRRTYESQWMHLFYADALERFGGDGAVAAHVRRNGFWFPAASTHADDLMTHRVLKALFEPIREDYRRVAAEVGAFPVEGLTVLDVVRRLPGSFLRDVEDALDELADTGVLEFDGERYRRAEGSRTATAVADGGSAGARGAVRSASLH
ncbi:MAG TPA: SDR family oxidoreductase [Longimicrobiales bacterium]|nr:SDR family oxidoreductase [Longimicrobiales bacterium]